MIGNWRAWALAALLAGPVLTYVGLGALWLAQHRGPIGFQGELLLYATLGWVISGLLLAVLASRWTKARRPLLPPIDWDAPGTFTPFDRQAWDLVQEEAGRGDEVPITSLSNFDVYQASGRGLARRLAAHYHPLSTDPLEHVPVVELLTALQLASEDLAQLCREVPGGDMLAPAHWKKAVNAAGYLQRASDLYTLLLPVFQPITGLARLGTQRLMVQPAWKNTQENLMRWFFRAYVNRLGTHLIELYSGRLAIGADTYRRLCRKGARYGSTEDRPTRLKIAVAGAPGAGKSTLIQALEQARGVGFEAVRNRFVEEGYDEGLSELLRTARFVEIPTRDTGPSVGASVESTARASAVDQAAESDLLLLVIDAASDRDAPEMRFVASLREWYAAHPGRESPPLIIVLSHVDRPELGETWNPPHDWLIGRQQRERVVRKRIEQLRSTLGPEVIAVVPAGLGTYRPSGVVEGLLPHIFSLLHRAERVAILRRLQDDAGRSKARRLAGQVGRQGRRLWDSIRVSRAR